MKLSRIVLFTAVVAAVLLAIAGPGVQLGLWHFRTGFLLMRIALFTGLAAAVLALLFLLIPKLRTRNVPVLAAALLLGLASAWVPWNGYQTARSVPAIHDITTDTANPPAFVAVVPLRATASNPPEYAGEETAKQQHEAYPDLQTLRLDATPAEAFRMALDALEDMGLEIVAAEAAEGRIEATATTFWFGFKDDVVVRIVADDNGSRLDMRSKSRVGRSDVGANAARIRRFLSKLQE